MLDDSKWKRVRRLMVKLAVSCRYLPPSLYLKDGIQLELVYPVNRGSNAEIYRGIYKGDTVAVKRLWFGAPLGRTEADQLREASRYPCDVNNVTTYTSRSTGVI